VLNQWTNIDKTKTQSYSNTTPWNRESKDHRQKGFHIGRKCPFSRRVKALTGERMEWFCHKTNWEMSYDLKGEIALHHPDAAWRNHGRGCLYSRSTVTTLAPREKAQFLRLRDNASKPFVRMTEACAENSFALSDSTRGQVNDPPIHQPFVYTKLQSFQLAAKRSLQG